MVLDRVFLGRLDGDVIADVDDIVGFEILEQSKTERTDNGLNPNKP